MENFERRFNPDGTQLDTLEEKKSLIVEKLGIEYTEEEKIDFNQWLERIPENSAEKPIIVANIEEIPAFLPKTANYKGERINLVFAKQEGFTPEDLQTILENFAQQKSSFEISLTKHNDHLISIGIGDKVKNSSTLLKGEYFGHYHPTQIQTKLECKEILPDSFVAGLMPSPGDIKGFLEHPESVINGTRIFSDKGYIYFRLVEKVENPDPSFDNFEQKYFDLFLGENKFDFKSDKEMADYFRKNFGIEIEFHYFDEKTTETDKI